MSQTTRVHCVIATDQSLPNLIPLVQLKPHRVRIIASTKMHDKALAFGKLLTQRLALYDSEDVAVVEGLPSHDIGSIEEWATDWLIGLRDEFPHASLVLNATGGTKPIMLGLVRAFESDDNTEILYTETDHDQIEWLHPRNRTPAPFEPVLNIENYLQAMGRTPRRAQSDDENWLARAQLRKSLTKWLASNADKLGHFFATVSSTLHKDCGEDSARRWELGSPASSALWQQALQRAEEAGLIDRDGRDAFYLKFADSRRYLTGTWLEEYVWHVLRDEGIEQVQSSLDLTENHSPSSDVRNEIDVIAVHRNRLLVVECKVRNLESDTTVAETIYKLGSISAGAGGDFGQRWLINAGSMGKQKAAERNLARAQGADIPVISATELGKLPAIVRQWKKTLRVNLDN